MHDFRSIGGGKEQTKKKKQKKKGKKEKRKQTLQSPKWKISRMNGKNISLRLTLKFYKIAFGITFSDGTQTRARVGGTFENRRSENEKRPAKFLRERSAC